MRRPHVVILGAGFGGVYVAKRLKRAVRNGEIDLTIINRTNSFLFTPLLHEVATGGLSPRTVAEPLREIFARTGVRIIQGQVESINSVGRRLSVRTGEHSLKLDYDYLVIATGAETNFYGIPGAAENTLSLKSLKDAIKIRDRIIDAFEEAVVTEDEAKRRALLSFAIVGGGATGVEVAAELAEFIDGMVKRYYGDAHCRVGDPRHCRREEPKVALIHAGKELLEQFAPSLRASVYRHLSQKGVAVMVEAVVTEVTAEGLKLASGTAIPAATIIWTAGVKASAPVFEDVKPTLIGGRMAVDNYFRLLGSKDIFVLGDAAAYVDQYGGSHQKPLPQLAQVAEAQSETVAANVLASIRKQLLQDFHYESKGSMVSVGQWFAIGEIYSMHMAGRFTWWLWRTVYLFKFASWKKRIRIGFEWFIQMFFPRDITRIS